MECAQRVHGTPGSYSITHSTLLMGGDIFLKSLLIIYKLMEWSQRVYWYPWVTNVAVISYAGASHLASNNFQPTYDPVCLSW